MQLVLTHASQYHRRVVSVLNQFPFVLLKMTKSARDKVCEERKAIANRLMSTDESKLETSTLKFRRLFSSDCLHAASTGLLTHRLEVALGGLRHMMRSDVRESERVNKQIKLILERSPSATCDLLSSRVALKYYLGQANVGSGHTRAKWSSYKPIAQKLQNDCLAGWDSKEQLSSRADRFAPPVFSNESSKAESASVNLDDTGHTGEFWSLSHGAVNREFVKLKPDLQTTGSQHAWAVCYNMQLGKKIQELWSGSALSETSGQVLSIPAICFASRKPTETRSSFTTYMAVEKVRTTYRMVPCHFDSKTNRLRVLLPLRFTSSIDLIASHFAAVKKGTVVGVFGVKLCSLGDVKEGSLCHGLATEVVKILQLQPPSKKNGRTVGRFEQPPSTTECFQSFGLSICFNINISFVVIIICSSNYNVTSCC